MSIAKTNKLEHATRRLLLVHERLNSFNDLRGLEVHTVLGIWGVQGASFVLKKQAFEIHQDPVYRF